MTNPRMLLIVLLVAVASACGGTSERKALEIDSTIDSVAVSNANASNPLRFDPREEGLLRLTITNPTDSPVEVRRVRIEGELLGLNFLTYDARVQLTVDPGATREVEIPLDFFELERQASGYLRAFVRVYDQDGTRVASQPFALDIRGNATSMMALFSMGLFLVTVITAVLNVRDLRTNQLPEQRFARGIRFLVPGLGLGLLLSVAFSVLRIFPLPATGWVPLTVIPTIAGFAIGYFVVPEPGVGDDAEDDDDEFDDPDHLVIEAEDLADTPND